MSIIEQGIRVWETDERIKGYCATRGYNSQDCSALRQLSRLKLVEATGLCGTVEDALASIAAASEEQKATFRQIGSSDPALCNALFKLAEDHDYAMRMMILYEAEIKPTLKF